MPPSGTIMQRLKRRGWADDSAAAVCEYHKISRRAVVDILTSRGNLPNVTFANSSFPVVNSQLTMP